MTVYAHIKTTRATNDYGSISFNSKNAIDVWLVTVSQSLSEKSRSEVQEILGIVNYGIWITFPYKNYFWVITNLPQEFSVQEFLSADLEDVYTKYELDTVLSQKAEISHAHAASDILDLDDVIQQNMDILSDDINSFLDDLIQELLK